MDYGAVLATKRGEPDARTNGADGEDEAHDREAAGELLATNGFPLPQQMVEIAATKACQPALPRHGENSGGRFRFGVARHRDRGRDDIGVDVQYPWEDSAAPLSRAPCAHQAFLHRQVSRHQRRVQEVPRRDALPSAGRPQFPATTGRTARIPRAGTTSPSPGSRWKMRAPTPPGPASACRTSGSGSTPRRAPTAASIPGATSGMLPPCPRPTRAAPCAVPTHVDAHPKGASPFGVMDLVGNVWQWTDEFVDEHTRARHPARRQLLSAAGIHLVLPAGLQTTEHGKLLLMAPSKDRSAALGFRCVVDAQ